jgi:mRNA-degrading endonuclease RelE of RelBE toxin-antitoxin system
MIFKLIILDKAKDALNKLSRDNKGKIEERLEVLKETPWRKKPNADIKKLKNAGENWRIRIGDYRAVYTIIDNTKEVRVKKFTHSNKKKKIYKQVGRKL